MAEQINNSKGLFTASGTTADETQYSSTDQALQIKTVPFMDPILHRVIMICNCWHLVFLLYGINCLNSGQAHNQVGRTFLQYIYKNLNVQCHFNMHNIHIRVPSF